VCTVATRPDQPAQWWIAAGQCPRARRLPAGSCLRRHAACSWISVGAPAARATGAVWLVASRLAVGAAERPVVPSVHTAAYSMVPKRRAWTAAGLASLATRRSRCWIGVDLADGPGCQTRRTRSGRGRLG
jgi:hypothetical protein